MDKERAQKIKSCLDTLSLKFKSDLSKCLGEDVHLELGHISFAGNTLKAELKVTDVDENGEVMTRERQLFLQKCHDYGLKPSDLGRTFVVKDQPFKLVGYNPANRSRKFIATSGGKEYKFTPDLIKRKLG